MLFDHKSTTVTKKGRVRQNYTNLDNNNDDYDDNNSKIKHNDYNYNNKTDRKRSQNRNNERHGYEALI